MLSGNSLRQTVHTHRASVHQAVKLVAALLRVARVTAGLAESKASLPPGLWPAGWLQRTGISSWTQCLVIEYGLPLPLHFTSESFFLVGLCYLTILWSVDRKAIQLYNDSKFSEVSWPRHVVAVCLEDLCLSHWTVLKLHMQAENDSPFAISIYLCVKSHTFSLRL